MRGHLRRWRQQSWIAWSLIGSAAVVIGLRLWLIQGTAYPVRVATGSMAPTLLGTHHRFRCPTCGIAFRCDAESLPAAHVVCPNCGENSIPVAGNTATKGTRVLIDRWPYWWSQPQRGDIVAFQRDAAGDVLEVKRVIGLPGEIIAIDAGDLFVDGERLRKSWSEFQQVAIRVHDDEYRPADELPRRWRAQGASQWRPTATGYTRTAPESQTSDTDRASDWLTYHHRACIADLVPPRPRDADAFVVDHDIYNHSLSRSHLAPMHDLLLSMQVQVEGEGKLIVATSRDRDGLRLELNSASRQVTLYDADVKLGSAPLPLLRLDPFDLDFGFVDAQVVVAIAGMELLRLPLEIESPLFRSPTPFTIASTTDRVEIRGLRITRDIHYLHPYDAKAAWQSERLEADEYLVLGDNQPLSVDSRWWKRGGLAREKICGRIVLTSPIDR